MVWKFCEIWKSYGKRGSEGPKFCEILSHSVRYGMYEHITRYKITAQNFMDKYSIKFLELNINRIKSMSA